MMLYREAHGHDRTDDRRHNSCRGRAIDRIDRRCGHRLEWSTTAWRDRRSDDATGRYADLRPA